MALEDVVTVEFKEIGLRALIAGTKELKKVLSTITTQMRGAANAGTKNLFGFAREQSRDVADLQKANSEMWQNYFKNTKGATRLTSDFKKNIKNLRSEFAGWALSMLFAGQALKQITNSIFRKSSQTFNAVAHSVENTVTGFDLLGGQMKFLQFTAGAALEPLATMIIPVIAAVADWISNNEALFRWLVAIFAVIGTALAAGGAIILFVKAMQELKIILSFSNAATIFSGVSGQISTLLPKLKTLNNKFLSFKNIIGAGLIIAVGMDVFGRGLNEKPTAKDWLKNLGVAAIGGYMLGGAVGAGIAIGLLIIAEFSKESISNMLKEAERLKEALDRIMFGDKGITADDILSGDIPVSQYRGRTIIPSGTNQDLLPEEIADQLFEQGRGGRTNTQLSDEIMREIVRQRDQPQIIITNLNVTATDSTDLINQIQGAAR